MDAVRLTRCSRAMLARYVRRGVLTHYRTEGGHRRYDLDELKALRDKLKARRAVLLGDTARLKRVLN